MNSTIRSFRAFLYISIYSEICIKSSRIISCNKKMSFRSLSELVSLKKSKNNSVNEAQETVDGVYLSQQNNISQVEESFIDTCWKCDIMLDENNNYTPCTPEKKCAKTHGLLSVSNDAWLKKLRNHGSRQKVIVCIRKRPSHPHEIEEGKKDVVNIAAENRCVLRIPRVKYDMTKYFDNLTFHFDHVFDEYCSTKTCFDTAIKPLIQTTLNGGSSMCFAYGQTGSGKTYTMFGRTDPNEEFIDGFYVFTINEIFNSEEIKQYLDPFVTCSFIEIYCGKVFDLLNFRKPLKVLEDQNSILQIKHIKEKFSKSPENVIRYLKAGIKSRKQGVSSENEHSSRSHAIFQICVWKDNVKYGKISLVDLAGSENASGNHKPTSLERYEAAHINKSLLSLKECARCLADAKTDHIPFRASTLTKILRDSFLCARSKLCLIATLSPGIHDLGNTVNTLLYADRIKEIRVKINPSIIIGTDKVIAGNSRSTDKEICKPSEMTEMQTKTETRKNSKDNQNCNIQKSSLENAANETVVAEKANQILANHKLSKQQASDFNSEVEPNYKISIARKLSTKEKTDLELALRQEHVHLIEYLKTWIKQMSESLQKVDEDRSYDIGTYSHFLVDTNEMMLNTLERFQRTIRLYILAVQDQKTQSV